MTLLLNIQTSKLQTFHTKCTSLQIYLRMSMSEVQPHHFNRSNFQLPTFRLDSILVILFLTQAFLGPFPGITGTGTWQTSEFFGNIPGVHLLVVVFVPPKGIGLQCTLRRLDVVFGHPRMGMQHQARWRADDLPTIGRFKRRKNPNQSSLDEQKEKNQDAMMKPGNRLGNLSLMIV